MAEEKVLDLKSMVTDGSLFRPPDDAGRIEAFIPPMGHENHAANMVQLANGDLLCVWFAGTGEGISDVNIALSRLPAGESRWTTPVLVSDDFSRSEQNPLLFLAPDGKLRLFYTAQETRGCSHEEWTRRVAAGEAEGGYTMQWTAVIRSRVSTDGGHTWGPVEVFSERPGSFCRQPVVVMSNGEWLFPMYYSLPGAGHGDDYTVMRISGDQGQSWQEVEVPGSRGRVHASVVELDAGKLVAFFRSRAADWIYVSRSPDYGRTWSVPVSSALPNNNASIQATRLASGRVAIIFNNVRANDDPNQTVWPRQRYPVTVALSEDGGETWPYMRHIDASDDFCGEQNVRLNRRCAYPCILQTADGAIHIGYSYRNRQCIKYVRVTENWVRDQLDWVFDGEDGQQHVARVWPFPSRP
jgi:predicted neuraminidase